MKKMFGLLFASAIGLALVSCSFNPPLSNVSSCGSTDISSFASSDGSSALLSSIASSESNATSRSSSRVTKVEDAASKKSSSSCQSAVSAPSNKEIAPKVQEYILKGQDNLSSAQRLNWSERFLNQVDISSVYQKYLANGGKADNIQSIAQYLTANAPVADNWKQLFETDLKDEYGVKPSRYESLEDNLYQVYVKVQGKVVPYVVVNARTGYFHG